MNLMMCGSLSFALCALGVPIKVSYVAANTDVVAAYSDASWVAESESECCHPQRNHKHK